MPLVATSLVAGLLIRHAAAVATFSIAEWTLVYIASCLTMGFALTPTTFVAIASGFFLGWASFPALVVSYVGASLIGYAAASVVDRGRLLATVTRQVRNPRFIERLKSGEVMIVIGARLSPMLPFAVMNVVLSAMRVGLRTFILAGIVGMIPRTLVSIWVGMQFHEITSAISQGHELGLVRVAVIVLSLVSILIIYVYVRRVARGIAAESDQQTL